ncbi:5074_t:CDS:2 [Ambispora gerdemannii]|uniref:5074_t:CDS:1 n=1 Tax=Ambispora gerdemannii TaxID=144530 RepID=A0A9N9BZ47_9GLOM|nr:5074_t:CDS:2 [Ambispora gerdemannii]
MKEDAALIIISGVSGVGKSEVMKRLLTYPELNSQRLITTTTRLPRVGEINGQDYYFVSRKEFIEGIINNQFLEYVEYNDNYYGTSLNSLKKSLLRKNVLLIVDVRGFQKIKEKREVEIKKRLAIAERETPFAKEYDYIITVNDNLEEVAAEIKKKVLDLI